MKKLQFSILDLIVAFSCIAVAGIAFRSIQNSAVKAYYSRLGHHPGRTLWPSDAGVLECLALIVVIAILIFMPVNAIVRRPNGSIFEIRIRYYLGWIIALIIYPAWYGLRSTTP